MALGNVRRAMRIQSLTTAAQMIRDMQAGGLTAEELNLSDEEFAILLEENEKVANKLETMAVKLER